MPKQYMAADYGYVICMRCSKKPIHAHLGTVKAVEEYSTGTIVCNQCDRFMPAKDKDYRPTQTEIAMSERGFIHGRSFRPSVQERKAFRQMVKALNAR